MRFGNAIILDQKAANRVEGWGTFEISGKFCRQKKMDPVFTGSILNYPFEEDQTMQIYGDFEGFPLSALFGSVISRPLFYQEE